MINVSVYQFTIYESILSIIFCYDLFGTLNLTPVIMACLSACTIVTHSFISIEKYPLWNDPREWSVIDVFNTYFEAIHIHLW